MSHIPPNGPPPPYSYGYQAAPQPAPHGSVPGYAYVPTPVMMPMPVYHPPPASHAPHVQHHPEPGTAGQPTYVTNYYYQQPPQPEPVHVVQDPIDWACATPGTASALTHKAYVAGKEGLTDSPMWVIRAHHSGEFVPGKYSVKNRTAYIPHGGKEVPVHNFEVLLAQPHMVRWITCSHGQVPVGAIPAGNTHNGEPLYIARVRHLRSVTPGKVHPSHGCCYISYSGAEVSYKNYEVLCNIVG